MLGIKQTEKQGGIKKKVVIELFGHSILTGLQPACFRIIPQKNLGCLFALSLGVERLLICKGIDFIL